MGMPLQSSLFEDRLDREFADFHAANPEVFVELRRMALDLKARGYANCGMKMLWEVVRWTRMIETADPSGATWKLNNNYTSRYARLLMEAEPGLAGFFETRVLSTDERRAE